MAKNTQKFVVQQRSYYLGGKGYMGAICRRLNIAPGRVYRNLDGAIRDAQKLTNHNDHGWLFVVYPFMTREEREKAIQGTIARMPKGEDGKPLWRTWGGHNCEACRGEGFILNNRGFFEYCSVCEGTGTIKLQEFHGIDANRLQRWQKVFVNGVEVVGPYFYGATIPNLEVWGWAEVMTVTNKGEYILDKQEDGSYVFNTHTLHGRVRWEYREHPEIVHQ
jgi:hypothetical protein